MSRRTAACLALGVRLVAADDVEELRAFPDEAAVLADGVLGHELEVAAVPPARLARRIARVHDRHAQAASGEVVRGRRTGEPGADDEHVDRAFERRVRAEAGKRLLAAQPVRRRVSREIHYAGPCTRNVENCQTSSSAGCGRPKPTNGSDQRSSGVQSDRCEAIGPRYGFAAVEDLLVRQLVRQAHAAPRVRKQPLDGGEHRRRHLQRRRVLVRHEPPRLVDVEQRADTTTTCSGCPISSTPSSSRPSTMSSSMIRCVGLQLVAAHVQLVQARDGRVAGAVRVVHRRPVDGVAVLLDGERLARSRTPRRGGSPCRRCRRTGTHDRTQVRQPGCARQIWLRGPRACVNASFGSSFSCVPQPISAGAMPSS